GGRNGADVQGEAVATHDLRGRSGRQGLADVLPGDVERREELKVRLRGDLRRVDVDHDAVRAGCREVDAVADRTVRRDGRMMVHDLAQIAPNVDDVDAGMRARAAAELRQRLPVGLHDAEGKG